MLNNLKYIVTNYPKFEMRRLGSELRQRKHLKVIQELDAFPKVPESYQKTTASGGTGQ